MLEDLKLLRTSKAFIVEETCLQDVSSNSEANASELLDKS